MDRTIKALTPERRARARGRPRAAEEGVRLSTWFPVSDADRLIRLARQHDCSVSTMLRRIVIVSLSDFSS